MQSHSVQVQPFDSRCRYWAKISRATETLPIPSNVFGANDIPGPYLQHGDEELFPGDVLFEGEANHHRRTDRGWTYRITLVLATGQLLELQSGFTEQKKQLKQQGLSAELLGGSGDIAAMVRIAHGIRLGLNVHEG